jgi:hypothetical protein
MKLMKMNKIKISTALGIGLLCLAIDTASADEPVLAPSYEQGQTFIYDDGRVEQYTKTDGNMLVWKHRSGRTYSRSSSFFVPILKWKTSRSRGARTVQGKPDRVWPLHSGQRIRFSVITNSDSRKKNQKWKLAKHRRSVQFWKCETRSMVSIQVPAGQFETYPIACQKYSTSSMKVLQEQIWYYSPAVGHYIRKDNVSFLSGRHSSILLVATLSGRAANPKRIRAVLDSLNP